MVLNALLQSSLMETYIIPLVYLAVVGLFASYLAKKYKLSWPQWLPTYGWLQYMGGRGGGSTMEYDYTADIGGSISHLERILFKHPEWLETRPNWDFETQGMYTSEGRELVLANAKLADEGRYTANLAEGLKVIVWHTKNTVSGICTLSQRRFN
jgi:hypothetical protein